jgi:hypothetical protein
LAVAAVTLSVFLGSLAWAYVLSERQPKGNRAQRVTLSHPGLGALALTLPGAWTQHASQEDGGRQSAVEFYDDAEPARRLLVVPIQFAEPQHPVGVLDQAVKVLLNPQQFASLQTAQPATRFRRRPVQGAHYVGISRDEASDVVRQHFLAVITLDGRAYWVLYLSHATGGEQDAQASLSANAALLRELLSSAAMGPEGRSL